MKSFSEHLIHKSIVSALNEGWEEDVRTYVMNDGQGLYNLDLEMLTKKFPNKAGRLYRGLNFNTPQQYLNFRRQTKSGYIETNRSAWSYEFGTAQDFAMHRKVYIPTREVMTAYDKYTKSAERVMGFVGVILEIQVPAGIGFDVSASGKGAESEVIIKGGTFKLVNVHVEKRFQNLLKNMDFNATLNDWVTSSNGKRTKEVDWILANKAEVIYPEIKTKIGQLAAERMAASIQVGAHHEPKSKYDYISPLFPDGVLTLSIGADTTLYDVAARLGIPVSIDKPGLRNKVIKQIDAALKPLTVNTKLKLSHAPLVHEICRMFCISPRDIPHIRTYFATVYKNHDDMLHKIFRGHDFGPNIRINQRDVTTDLTDVLNVAQSFAG